MPITRDRYIAILEKRAADESEDSQDTALDHHTDNQGDIKSQLGSLFTKAAPSGQADSKLVGKLFPGKSKKESGYPLMKVAHQVFARARSEGLLKEASPMYLQVAYHSFVNELEKIAAWAGAGSGALHTALDAARKKPQTVGGTAQKFMGQYMKPKMAPPARPLAQGSVATTLPPR